MYSYTLPKISFKHRNQLQMSKIFRMKVSLDCEFEALELVKVKAHKRILNGKIVKVRSYYRRVRKRK